MEYTIRHAAKSDAARINEIYVRARQFMREHGNPNQWKNTFPTVEEVEEDIRLGLSLVCEVEGEVEGVFIYLQGEDAEPDYRKIDGEWLADGEYGVVHRIASSGRVKGVGEAMIRWALSRCADIRIDTHADNYVMQSLLAKLGFSRRGIIILSCNGEERIAFERVD